MEEGMFEELESVRIWREIRVQLIQSFFLNREAEALQLDGAGVQPVVSIRVCSPLPFCTSPQFPFA